MKKIILLFLILITIGCSSTTDFTHQMREKIEDTGTSLKQIQFYNDQKIVLKRELNSGKTDVEYGKVKLENGKYIHYIILPANTPGICTYIGDRSLGISFDSSSNDYLEFGDIKSDLKQYRIWAYNWEKHYGIVVYNDEEYIIQPEGSNSGLVIKKSVLNKLNIERKRLKGIRLDANY